MKLKFKLLLPLAMFSLLSFASNETNKLPAPIGAYSHISKAGGTYFASGQLGLVPTTNKLRKTFIEQVDQILVNTDALLKEHGMDRSHIVKTTVFITSFEHYSYINEAYSKFFKAPYPVRTTVGVKQLPKDAMVEIEWVAHKD